jgi:hypothetical protein
MRRERIIAGAAIGVLLIGLIAWVVTHTYWAEVTRETPMQGEAARNPHYTLAHLAARLGIRTREIVSLRELPPDTVVLVNDPKNDLLLQRVESIESWVESGGRLVISGDILRAHGDLQSWSGVRLAHRDPDPAALTQAVPPEGTGSAPDADMGCAAMAVQVNGGATGQSLRVCAPAAESYWASDRVPAWSLADAQGPQVVSVDIGDGEVTVIGPSEILGNRALLAGDHAELVIAAAGLRHQDTLLILSPPELISLPALLWRLAAPAIVFFVAAMLLLVLRYLPRFGPPLPATAPARRSLADQIRGYARFVWRTHEPQVLRTAMRRSLEAAARRQISEYGTLGLEQRAHRLATSTGIDSGAIAAALTEGAPGKLNEHRAAMTLLEVCRRILVKSDSRTQGTLHER